MAIDLSWIEVYVGKDIPPYNGRNFADDLRWLTSLVIDERVRGMQSWDQKLGKIPFFPETGYVHQVIDEQEGSPNQSARLEARDYVARRHAWVIRLIEGLKTQPRITLVNQIIQLERHSFRRDFHSLLEVASLLDIWDVYLDVLEEELCFDLLKIGRKFVTDVREKQKVELYKEAFDVYYNFSDFRRETALAIRKP